MDRCDTPEYWFLFASCGRPYAAYLKTIELIPYVKMARRAGAFRGVSLEVRGGNHAAATLEQLSTDWPEPRDVTTSDCGSMIYVRPHDYAETSA